MFGGYESVDEQEWQWIQQERNEHGGDLPKNLKVPNRLIKVHASVSSSRQSNKFPDLIFFFFLVNGWPIW